MTAPPWFRFYSETLTDRKIDRICRATGQPKMNIVGAWTILLALANDSPVRGVLLLTEDIPFTLGDLAGEMGVGRDVAEAIVSEFRKFDMIHEDEYGTLYITHWNGRQFASDSSTERVQRYRAKNQALPDTDCNEDETLQERDGNLPEQSRAESDTDQSIDRTDTYTGKPVAVVPDGLTEGQRLFLAAFGAKRFRTNPQKAAVLELERQYGTDKLSDGVQWAAKQGMNMGKAVISLETALKKWGQPKGDALRVSGL